MKNAIFLFVGLPVFLSSALQASVPSFPNCTLELHRLEGEAWAAGSVGQFTQLGVKEESLGFQTLKVLDKVACFHAAVESAQEKGYPHFVSWEFDDHDITRNPKGKVDALTPPHAYADGDQRTYREGRFRSKNCFACAYQVSSRSDGFIFMERKLAVRSREECLKAAQADLHQVQLEHGEGAEYLLMGVMDTASWPQKDELFQISVP